MATSSDEKIEISKDEVSEKKPSKESLSQKAEEKDNDDTDLDQLLDSALGDFDKPLQPPAAAAEVTEIPPEAAAASASSPGLNILTTKTAEKETKEEKDHKEESKPPPGQEALFESLFNDSPATQQSVTDFENVLSGLMTELGQGFGADPQAAAEMQRMFQGMAAGMGPGPMAAGMGLGPMAAGMGLGPMAAGMGLGPNAPSQGTPAPASASNPSSTPSQGDLTSTLTDTINRLAQNARDLQEDQLSDDDLLRSLGGMNLQEGDADLLPMVQTMMQSLLSKDVLYPSLKEVVDKYQNWLDEKEPTLSGADYQRYSEQHGLMRALCQQYEAEQDSDSAAVKKQRMGKIMELIQQMESLGQPPAEIVGDMNTGGLSFDENGLPKFPGLPQGDQCSVM